jgi:hypothetical protein
MFMTRKFVATYRTFERESEFTPCAFLRRKRLQQSSNIPAKHMSLTAVEELIIERGLDINDESFNTAFAWLLTHILQCVEYLDSQLELRLLVPLNPLMTLCVFQTAMMCDIAMPRCPDVEFVRMVKAFYGIRHQGPIRRLLFRAVFEELCPELIEN